MLSRQTYFKLYIVLCITYIINLLMQVNSITGSAPSKPQAKQKIANIN